MFCSSVFFRIFFEGIIFRELIDFFSGKNLPSTIASEIQDPVDDAKFESWFCLIVSSREQGEVTYVRQDNERKETEKRYMDKLLEVAWSAIVCCCGRRQYRTYDARRAGGVH